MTAVAWLALMTVPVVGVALLLGRADAWLDRRQGERDVVRGAEQYLRDRAARHDAEPSSGSGLFAIQPPTETDPT